MRYLFVFLLFINSSLVQSQTAKQPNCADIDAMQIEDMWKRPTGADGRYLDGVYKICKDGKIVELMTSDFWKKWYKNGQLKEESHFNPDTKDCHDCPNQELSNRSWYENGQLKYEWNFKDDETDNDIGSFGRKWYESGELKSKFISKWGTIISEKCWDKDGNRIKCD